MEKKTHPIFSGSPHVILSLEHPMYPVSMKYSETMHHLKSLGSGVEHISGRYGGVDENSLIVHNPTDLKKIKEVAKNAGQEALIYSANGMHELHVLNGDDEGAIMRGMGHTIHPTQPLDNYSTVDGADGKVHFSYNFDTLKKSQGPMIHLVHFSPKPDLQTLDPSFQGTAGAGAEKGNIAESRTVLAAHKKDVSKHPYLHAYGASSGAPEEAFKNTTKYHIKVPANKIYDLSLDPSGVLSKVKQDHKDVYFPGESAMVHPDLVHNEIKKMGYEGFKVSQHKDPLFAKTVMLYNNIPVLPSHLHSGTSAVKAEDQSFSTKV